MKKNYLGILIVTVGLVCWVLAATAFAAPVNPDPAIYGSDDGTEWFVPSQDVLTLEMSDVSETLGYYSVFGFFFESDPGNPIVIYDAADNTTVGGSQFASIDFAAGTVTDVDASQLKGNFFGSGKIGFFYGLLDPADLSLLALASTVNSGGLDQAGTFPVLGSPNTYLLGFETPAGELLSFDVVQNVAPVPLPSALFLFGSGLAGLFSVVRKKANRNS